MLTVFMHFSICFRFYNNYGYSASGLPIHGPLLMHPPAEDNYGVDACSLIVVGGNPAVAVVATCEGKLHHCVVLPASGEDSQSLQVRHHVCPSVCVSVCLCVGG